MVTQVYNSSSEESVSKIPNLKKIQISISYQQAKKEILRLNIQEGRKY